MIKINKIYCEDVFTFLKKIPYRSIDVCVADPPYNIDIDKWDSFETEEAYMMFMKRWLRLLIPRMKETGSIYLFNNQYNSAQIVNYLKDKPVKFKNWITWYKKDGFSPSKTKYVSNQEVILFYTMKEKGYTFNYDDIRTPYLSTDRMKAAMKKGILKNGKRWYPNKKGKLCTDVWEFSSDRHAKKVNGRTVKNIHPTPKPEAMIERMLLASSKEGDLILDLFSGTGTTSYVAKKLKRNFVGCDNIQEYVDYSIKRLNGEL